MASKSDIRICVSIGEQISRLFSVKERSNGDLVINMQAAEFYREEYNPLSNQDPKIINQKYSIHCSNKSKEKINAIVHRIKFCNDKVITTSNYTKALKQTNNYAAIYIARAPDLSLPKYAVKPSDRSYVSISTFDTRLATIYYMICVCNHVTEAIAEDINYSVKYIDFIHFKLAVIWSYSPLPSHSSGHKGHFMTIPPEDSNQENEALIKEISEGYGARDIVKLYQQARFQQHQEFYTVLSKSMPELESKTLNMLFSLPFTSKPRGS
jgi:hypothetical protein